MFGWNFPPGGNGERTGLNNSGVETFRSKLIESLTREIIQNSCDARDENSVGPVEVRFELSSLPSDHLPGCAELEQVMLSSRDVWSHLPESVHFFDKALETLRSAEIPMLKISDARTTGLTGAREDFRGNWNALVKSSGVSEKSSQSGGSFGIGKNAPFACSTLRTVYYGTLDQNGVTAFQGVARLVTHKNIFGEYTQGTGFFGETAENKPLIGADAIREAGVNQHFVRSEIGTDLFIPGFSADEDWEVQMVRAVLEHFFVAVLEGQLVVQIGSHEINAATFPVLLEKFGTDEDGKPLLVTHYYRAYITPKAPPYYYSENLGDLGEMQLYLITDRNLPKRVAMFRSTGMKIHDKRFQEILPFAGVFIAKGDRLNAFLRDLEPPNHQSWDSNLHRTDKKYANKQLTKLYDWVKAHLKPLTTSEITETIEVEGMSQFLPDDLDDRSFLGEPGEGLRTIPQEFVVRQVRPVASEFERAKHETAVGKQEAEEENTDDENDSNPGGGGTPNGKKGDSEEIGGKEGQNGNGKGSGEAPARKTKLKSLKQIRTFCVDPSKGLYQVMFVPNADGQGLLGFTVVGEDGQEFAHVRAASGKSSNVAIPVVNKGMIGPFEMKGGQKNTILIELDNTVRYSLEVTLHAN